MLNAASPASTPPVVLSIAGSDSGGGAGIQADVKAIQANGAFAATSITAITAQNTLGVTAVHEVPPAIVAAQIDAVCGDLRVRAIKTGMLSSAPIIEAVADRLAALEPRPPIVVDPVMISTSGHALLRPDAIRALLERLLPLADLVTPNRHEAEALTGLAVDDLDGAEAAARALCAMGPRAALVKGGHLDGGRDEAIDLLLVGGEVQRIVGPRIDTPHTHGTGCTLASAIAAQLARGRRLPEAVALAKRYLTGALRAGLPLGAGAGPTHHFWFLGDAPPWEP